MPADNLTIAELGRRLRAHFWLKGVGTMVIMAAFFTGYFAVLRHPVYPVRLMPETALDRLVGFWPWALPAYVSLWLYVCLLPSLMVRRDQLVRYAVAALALSAVGLLIFHYWPTAVPAQDIVWARYDGFDFLKRMDAAGNACPSLHVAFAVFTAIGFEPMLREMGSRRWVRAVNWLWGLAIVYSTLATKQHLALDAYAGAALGALFGWGWTIWNRPRGERRARFRRPAGMSFNR